MVDPVSHRIFRQVKKTKMQPTRIIGGRIEEIDGDRVRVRITDQLEPVDMRADGVVTIGQEVGIPVGTDGRPMGAIIPGTVPVDAEPEYVGPTGRRILGQQLEIDQVVQELPGVRERLGELDVAVESARARIDQLRGINLVPNGGGDRGENGGWYGQIGGAWSLTWTEGGAPAGLPGRFEAGPNGAILNPAVPGVEPVPVEPGQTYLVEAWVRGTGAPGAFPISLAVVTVSGGVLALIPDATVEVDGLLRPITGTPPAPDAFVASGWAAPVEWTRIGAHFTAPEGVTEVYVYGMLPAGGAIAGVSMRRALVGEDIVASEVAAAVGVFIDAMMENLTVVGAANISEAAIGELTARIANIIRVNAEQIIVGRDARFWSGGLAFYAPPAEGQDPDDWGNRTPLIAVTPEGDVAIAAAQDGLITAYMTPEGEVGGIRGAFDELSVAGEDILERLERMPRGVLDVVRLTNTATLTSTAKDIMGCRAQLFKDRMYKFTYMVPLTVTSPWTQLVPRIRWSGGSANMRAVADSVGGEHTHIGYFSGAEVGFADGDSVEVVLEARAVTGSSQINLSAWAMLEDIGPAVEVRATTVSNPTPTETWYGPVPITSNAVWGVRPDGSNAIDPRLTLGGYNIYGTDMAENILYQFNFSRLAGSTVRKGNVSVTFTQNAPVSFAVYAGTGPTTGHVLLYSATANANGKHSMELTAAARQALVGKTCLVVKPFYPGNTASYGYMAAQAVVNVIYSK